MVKTVKRGSCVEIIIFPNFFLPCKEKSFGMQYHAERIPGKKYPSKQGQESLKSGQNSIFKNTS